MCDLLLWAACLPICYLRPRLRDGGLGKIADGAGPRGIQSCWQVLHDTSAIVSNTASAIEFGKMKKGAAGILDGVAGARAAKVVGGQPANTPLLRPLNVTRKVEGDVSWRSMYEQLARCMFCEFLRLASKIRNTDPRLHVKTNRSSFATAKHFSRDD